MKKYTFFVPTIILLLCLINTDAFAQSNSSILTPAQQRVVDSPLRLILNTEVGFVNILQNDLQQGKNGTEIDLPEEAGQDLFFPFMRLSVDVKIKQRHNIRFLYQPLDIKTRTVFTRDQVVDNETFPQGKPVDVRYGFDFYRLTYDYDLLASKKVDFAIGAGLQIRLARLEFTSVDGEQGRSRSNIGPVPLLRMRFKYRLPGGWWFGSELDGFYANLKFANGSTDSTVEGSIWDFSVRGGKQLSPGLDAFFNIRYLGGGAEGDNPSDDGRFPGSDGYSNNFLQSLSITLGFNFEPALFF